MEQGGPHRTGVSELPFNGGGLSLVTQNKEFKQRQKSAFDHRNQAHLLPPLADDIKVWVSSGQKNTKID